ncbi:MAG: hypothetical protein ACRDT8_09915 [Micromonosporaceae bacterium]
MTHSLFAGWLLTLFVIITASQLLSAKSGFSWGDAVRASTAYLAAASIPTHLLVNVLATRIG